MNTTCLPDLLHHIGRTPLIRLARFEVAGGASLWGKLESANPGGSVKDRIALAMITAAERGGQLQPGMTLVEPTSGNTGIGLALVCAARGYRLILTMPESMSLERRRLLQAYGAQLRLTAAAEGMTGAITLARQLARQPGHLMLDQFNNTANPVSHETTTGPELYAALDGAIDAFVAGVGTGGTLTGVGRHLRSRLPAVQLIAVEPAASAVLSGQPAAPHRIQGIGAGFVPPLLETQLIDRIVPVTDADAIATCVALTRSGIPCGISAGANVWAAARVAAALPTRAQVVTILCDNAERYLSTGIYDG